MKIKTLKFKFHFYVQQKLSGFGVDIFANDEREARDKLKKLIEDEFSVTVQTIEEME